MRSPHTYDGLSAENSSVVLPRWMADAELRASFSGVWPKLLDVPEEDYLRGILGRDAYSDSIRRPDLERYPGAVLYPLAGSTAVGVTPGGVTIGIGAGTASFP